MENQPNNNEENKTSGSTHEKGHFTNQNHLHSEHKNNDNSDIDDTDKYLAMEQPGVKFTNDTDPTVNSDQIDFGTESRKKEWSEDGGNSKNSDAFNQDDYLLEDNVDLDEDEGKSISSDDDDFEETNERY